MAKWARCNEAEYYPLENSVNSNILELIKRKTTLHYQCNERGYSYLSLEEDRQYLIERRIKKAVNTIDDVQFLIDNVMKMFINTKFKCSSPASRIITKYSHRI